MSVPGFLGDPGVLVGPLPSPGLVKRSVRSNVQFNSPLAETAIWCAHIDAALLPRLSAGRDFLEGATPTFACEIHVFAGKLQFQAGTSPLENVYNAVLASTLHAGQVRDLH